MFPYDPKNLVSIFEDVKKITYIAMSYSDASPDISQQHH